MNDLPRSLMTGAESDALVKLAIARRVLELGAWCGAQTVRMAKVAKVVWTVDSHTGDVHTGPADTLDLYMENLRQHHVTDNVVTVVADFSRVFYGVQHNMFDLVVIDGEHERASLLRDWYLSVALVDPYGFLAVHDWGRYDTLSWLADAAGEPVQLVETLAIFDASRYK